MHWLLAAFFEVIVLALSCVVALRVERTGDVPARVCLCVFIRLMLVTGIASIATLLEANSTATYVWSGVIVLVVLILLLVNARRSSFGTPAEEVGADKKNGIPAWGIIAASALFVPLFIATASPTEDTDSWAAFEGVLDWAENRRALLDFIWHYPGTWELQYVPITLLGGLKQLGWVPGAYAIAAIPFIAFDIARRCALPVGVCSILAVSSVSLYAFWSGPSGLWSFKNDMIYAAATLCLVLTVIRLRADGLNPTNLVLFSISCALILVKYSGALLLPSLLVLAAVYLRAHRRLAIRLVAPLAGGALIAGLLTTLPFYLENLVRYGNPLYPMSISIGPFVLPGKLAIAGTSILSHIGEPRALWILAGISPFPNRAGMLFGVLSVVAILGTFAIVFGRVGKREPLREADLVLASAGVAFIVYFSSFWSAGKTPDDLIYLAYSNPSIRYAMGALALGEIGVAAWLWTLNSRLRIILLLCVGVHVMSRVWLLYFSFPRGPTVTSFFSLPELMVAMAVGTGFALIFFWLRNQKKEIWAWIILLIALGSAGGFLVTDRSLELGRGPYRNGVNFILTGLENSPDAELLIIGSTEKCTLYGYRYPFYLKRGPGLVYVTRTRDEYLKLGKAGRELPMFVALYYNGISECGDFVKLRSLLADKGYELERENKFSMLWRLGGSGV